MPGGVDIWVRLKNIFRITYTLTFVLASMTGLAFALTLSTEYLIAFLIVLEVFILALFVNFSNDYFDYVSGADQARFTSENKEWERGAREILGSRIYWSGNAFDLGFITRSQGRMVMALLALIAVLLSIPIILYAGWIVVLLGLIAFFVSFFYTAPPLNLGARGFGEVDVFVSFFMISFFSFFVVVRGLNIQMVLIATIVGMNAAKIVTMMLVIVYVLSLLLLAFDYAYLLLLLSLPFSVRIVAYLRDRNDRFRFVRPTPEMFKFVLIHQLLIIVSLIVRTVLTSA
ncbi:MAG: prenyltransferase [Methanomassiliicoccales archaeon]